MISRNKTIHHKRNQSPIPIFIFIQPKPLPDHPQPKPTTSLRRINPRPALIRRTIPRTARPHKLPMSIIAVAVGSHAEAHAADARDGRRRPDQDLVGAGRADAADEGDAAGGVVELAVVEGVVIWCVDDADCDVVVCLGVRAMDGWIRVVEEEGSGEGLLVGWRVPSAGRVRVYWAGPP